MTETIPRILKQIYEEFPERICIQLIQSGNSDK